MPPELQVCDSCDDAHERSSSCPGKRVVELIRNLWASRQDQKETKRFGPPWKFYLLVAAPFWLMSRVEIDPTQVVVLVPFSAFWLWMALVSMPIVVKITPVGFSQSGLIPVPPVAAEYVWKGTHQWADVEKVEVGCRGRAMSLRFDKREEVSFNVTTTRRWKTFCHEVLQHLPPDCDGLSAAIEELNAWGIAVRIEHECETKESRPAA